MGEAGNARDNKISNRRPTRLGIKSSLDSIGAKQTRNDNYFVNHSGTTPLPLFAELNSVVALSNEEESREIGSRHGVLDGLMGTKLYEEGFLKNKYPYVRLNETEMNEELRNAAAKAFYVGWRKGDVIGSKLHEEYLKQHASVHGEQKAASD